MCNSSKVYEDWVVKGFHIHVKGVELGVYPDHNGKIGFKSVFANTSQTKLDKAIRHANEQCLPDPDVRKKWYQMVNSARTHLSTYRGKLQTKARGRLLEFTFILIALEREKEKPRKR